MARGGGCNLQLAWGSESPVDALGATAAGVHDAMGNVWTWTEDDFNPLEGFAVSPLYTDFSTPCFDGLHTVIMGGSFISTGDEVSPPHQPPRPRVRAHARPRT